MKDFHIFYYPPVKSKLSTKLKAGSKNLVLKKWIPANNPQE